MSPRQRTAGKQSKFTELTLDGIISLFKLLAALTGTIFIASCFFALVSEKDEATTVVYALILVINFIVPLGSLIAIKLFGKMKSDQ